MKLGLNFKENTQRLGVEFGQLNIIHDGQSGVSDWNDLKNRPFYDNADGSVGKQLDDKYLKALENVVVQKDIIPEQELAFELDPSSGVPALSGFSLFNMTSFTVGETYKVIWGEDNYDCTAYQATFSGMPCVGVGNAVTTGGEDNGLPFAFGVIVAEGNDYHNYCMIASFDGSYTKKVGIYQTEEGYKLKESYIPDSLYTQIDKRIEDYINEALGGDY